jgi:sarcosine oxidase, subunit alpha
VCPCAGVSVDDLADAWRRGFSEVELLKRATLAGTGPCQGAACLPHLRSFVAARADGREDAGRSAGSSAPFTARPVARQITMANAAAGSWLEPVKRTALDAEHRALGAQMERTGGWWRPWTYGDPDREYVAVRGSVGLCDVSTLGTFIVGGPDAVAFLERIYPTSIADLAVGRMRYSLLLDERGVVFDDGLVCREAADRYWLTVTTAGATFVEMWLRDWAEAWSMDVRIMDRTDALAAINVTGPQARSLLIALGVDPEALPGPMRFADLDVGGVSCRAMRSAFTGEVSFELVHAADESVRLWRALTDPEVDPVAVPHGLEALLRLRLEKGHAIVGMDTELDSTPRRLGLSALVDKAKPWFVGKEAMARSDALPLDRQLVGLELDGDAPADGEVLLVDGVLVGHVTSATHSPALGRSVALAWLTTLDGVMPETVECGLRRARRVATPFYDPEGVRARA